MNIAEKAFYGLYPDKELKHKIDITFSGKFSSYNANVKYTSKKMEFGLSRDWMEIDEDIKIGLLQHLMVKVFGTKKTTRNIELYNIFLKNIHTAIPKVHTHPVLEDSFDRVNESYFLGMVEKPNLKWGKHSTTKMGSYDYHSDAITISRIFLDAPQSYLDYVMFHEMLHKVHKFKVSESGRALHHSHVFRQREKDFENSERIEKNLGHFIRNWKRNNRYRQSGHSAKNPAGKKIRNFFCFP